MLMRHLQMILEAIVPAYLKHLQTSAGRKDPRTERDILSQLGVAIKTLIANAEALAKFAIASLSECSSTLTPRFSCSLLVRRNYSGPQRTFEKTPSQKPGGQCAAKANALATAIEIDEDSHSRFLGDHFRQAASGASATGPDRMGTGGKDPDSEAQWHEFRMPRTTLLSLVADYYTISNARLAELNKKHGQDKASEPFDVKCNTVRNGRSSIRRRSIA